MKRYFLIILFTYTVVNSFSQQQSNFTMFFDGIEREYVVYVPAIYNGMSNVPLMFNFHGGGGYASDHIQMINMNNIADTAGFIAVYPQGAIDYDGAEPGNTPSTSWLHKAPTSHNDVNFIAAIIDTLSNEYLVDENRVYACGYSEGGIFSYEIGCRLNDRIAAFASVSGSMMTDFYRGEYGVELCSPSHSTAMMLIPGTNDPSFHSMYDGFQPYYMSVDEITNYWSNYNNTDFNPEIIQISDLNNSDGSTVERKVWGNGDNCISIEELKVIGGNHDWPGSFGNMDINASEEIWNFVSKYDINGLINCNAISYNENNNFIQEKELIKRIDLLGRNQQSLSNNFSIEIYSDGSVEYIYK